MFVEILSFLLEFHSIHQHVKDSQNSCNKEVYLTFKILFIYLFLAVLGLCCWVGFSLAVASGACSLIAVYGLLTEVASLTVEHGSRACGFQWLWHLGSVVVAHGLSCLVDSSWTREQTHVSCIGR